MLGNGLFGWNLSRALGAARERHVVLTHEDVDLAEEFEPAVRVALHAEDVLVNAMALTNVDACEDREAEAARVNGEAPGALAALAADAGARFVHVSTDVVLAPTNVYARSKALGEAAVRKAVGDEALVLRLSTTFGPHPTRSDFVQWTLGKLREGKPFPVLVDMRSSPAYAPDAARATIALVRAGATGTRQFANHAGLSRLELARLVAEAWELPPVMVPTTMDAFRAFKAPRPRDTRMACTTPPEYDPWTLQACLEDYRRDPTRDAATARPP